jgi:hypothetical protein
MENGNIDKGCEKSDQNTKTNWRFYGTTKPYALLKALGSPKSYDNGGLVYKDGAWMPRVGLTTATFVTKFT